MSFSVQILGNSSATFANGRHQSSQFLRVYGSGFLIDCGEGTQLQLSKYKIGHQKIDAIFISHLHGDHFLGLFGLLSTMSLMGRKKKLLLFAPKGLKEIIQTQAAFSATYFTYDIIFQEINVSSFEPITRFKNLIISAFPLQHRIECYGYKFEETPKPRKLIKDKIDSIPTAYFKKIKAGLDVVLSTGEVIKSNDVTTAPARSRSYAYCSDTRYFEELSDYVKNVDLLYHESTFTEEHVERAINTNHSTAKQAALIASRANVQKLLLGHFSARHQNLSGFIEEASTIFNSVEIAEEGNLYSVF